MSMWVPGLKESDSSWSSFAAGWVTRRATTRTVFGFPCAESRPPHNSAAASGSTHRCFIHSPPKKFHLPDLGSGKWNLPPSSARPDGCSLPVPQRGPRPPDQVVVAVAGALGVKHARRQEAVPPLRRRVVEVLQRG